MSRHPRGCNCLVEFGAACTGNACIGLTSQDDTDPIQLLTGGG